ncbi:MAG: hypothetical protein CMP61_04975 [Flavobacteriales bacterium]|nr:hypothetical protein [Flavobacteriales bacterium]|tara:strand:+ start:10031 stop:15157 length:5127 start_codon:yes stop_codon:yes gene_type:complete
MKQVLTYCLMLLAVFSHAQTANDWIKYDQSYFKFPIASDGMYRIEYQQLLNAGVNISDTAFDPRKTQLFSRGVEVPIFISGDDNGVFDPGDYIEFYGETNTGWYDHTLFSDSAHNLNPHVSMFSDTAYYFLTWNNSLDNARIIEEFDISIDTTANPPMPYYWEEIVYTYDPKEHISSKHSRFNLGQTTQFGYAVPEYSEGEGRYLWRLSSTEFKSYSISTPHKYSMGPTGWIKTKIFGMGFETHYFEVDVNDSLIYQDFFTDRKSVQITRDLPINWIEDNTTVTFQSTSPEDKPKDKVGIAYIHFRYAKEFNFDNQSNIMMRLPKVDEEKDLIEIKNFNDLNSTPRLYDLTSGRKIQVVPKYGKYYAYVPNSNTERKCLLTTEASIKSITGLESVSSGSSRFINFNQLIEEKGGVDYLLITGSSILDAANEYAVYRDSSGLRTIVSDVEQLYDQFSYGIRKHPMAIRNYADAILNYWGYDPTYMFLCGKSISMNNNGARFGSLFEHNIVPTWGVIGADAGFTAGLKPGTVLDPAIATGRLAVNNNSQLLDYLNKVKEYESAVIDDWMKQVLHFGGGDSESEQESFRNYLMEYEELIEDSFFGGYVHTFLKNSSDPLQLNLSDSVKSLINQGVSLMTFFGHAYSNNFDQSIDEPENYDNTGRYPFIIANSCLIGNVHSTLTTSGSERFVLSENKGAIGFLGSSSLGVPTYLSRYSREFYRNLSTDFYGWPLGKIIQQTIRDMQDSTNVLNRDVAMYMTLHCDPAIVLNTQEKPDFTIYGDVELSKPNVIFSPENISSNLDSFDLNLQINNIGKVQGDTFSVFISRAFPGVIQIDTTYVFQLVNNSFRNEIHMRLPVDKINGVGMNKFTIRVDGLSQVDELNELNNIVEVEIFINSSNVLPIFPYEFAIVPNYNSVLKASTGSPYSDLTTYFFQIDTSSTFDSPILTEEVIESYGGVLEWDPNKSLKLADFYNRFDTISFISTPRVFYWRVSADSSNNGGFKWVNSSFQFVNDKTGWGQAQFNQLGKNEFLFIDFNEDLKTLDFIEQVKTIKARTHLSGGWVQRQQTKYEIDGTLKCYESSYWSRMFFVAVIDRYSLEPWHSLEHGDYGHVNFQANRSIPEWNHYNFYFVHGNVGLDSLMSFYEDVPDSNYMLFYTFRGNYCSSYFTGQPISDRYEEMFTEIGASVDSLKNYPDNYPYILFFKKGDPGSVIESFSLDGLDYINLEGKMRNSWWNGKVTTPLIGPGKAWSSIHWDLQASEENNVKDSARISVYGVDIDGNQTLILDSLTGEGEDLNLGDYEGVSSYPYLKLESFFADDSLRTPDKIARWQVTYDEIPDAAINPLKLSGYTLIDSVQQGEDLFFITAIENISRVPMDSLQVSYQVINHEFQYFPISYKYKKALQPGEVIYDTVIVKTTDLIGENSLWYEINPFTGPNPWQLEQHHFNNSYLHSFRVHEDELNPLLDVTFDGVRILNGDIVNPQSEIVITLNDENQFLALDDASLLQVFINYPSSMNEDSLVLLDPTEYIFTPAELPKNKCKITLQGDFKQDGVHELRVMAIDKSRNTSGDGNGAFDYSISFSIVTESSISQLINYPNPFSTSTRFVFTLTGTEIPDQMFIQIMTINGKVVKEITQDELGPINIGRNITEYAWDGTDNYGDKLANGVYLYKVQTQIDGVEIKRREEEVSSAQDGTTLSSKYFKNGIGKLYILR